jgi:hypothetical protein
VGGNLDEKKFCTKKCYQAYRETTEYRAARFWAQVDKSGSCWIFTGPVESNGYGYPGWGRSHKLAHRLAHELLIGPIPKGMLVCHTCDTPPCCNPEHLFLGTKRLNGRDMSRKGRSGVARLTLEQVREVRAALLDYKHGLCAKLADKYGVSRAVISDIKLGNTFQAVE